MLAGLVVCGRCGYQMHVTYEPQQRYDCVALAANYGAATCLHIDTLIASLRPWGVPSTMMGFNTHLLRGGPHGRYRDYSHFRRH
ncbi:MAG TPA: recombinase zinc beta ribbon domain-containing protein [Chloroflexia bacterium]|nr:recombinase zinc beta ribbon domain-containing protein [Chloroflexia bacterium]